MLIYSGNRYDVKMACEVANLLIEYGYIETWLCDKKEFTFTKLKGDEIALYISIYKDIRYNYVSTYKGWYFSKARASYVNSKTKINTRKITSFASLVGTAVHENLHHLDHTINNKVLLDTSFNHGNNSPIGKEDSVQYYIGRKTKYFILELISVVGADPVDIYKHLVKEHGA